MKQEIRERIEKIRKGEVPEGYKKTKVGIIPVDWEVKNLEFVAEIIMGQSPKGSSYNSNEIGFALINGPTEFTDRFPIKIQWTSEPTKFCQSGDILLCVRGSSTGRINIANDKYCIGRGVSAIRAKDNCMQTLIEHLTRNAIQSILSKTTGSTFPNIDGKSLRSILIPFTPTRAEQQKIAEILSTWDKAIELKEKLIEKKKEFKRGLMHKLLRGELRFPEFDGKWKKVVIGEIPEGYEKTKVGIIPEEWDFYPLVNISSMNGRIGWQGLKQSEFTMNPKDPFLITGMNFKDGKIRWEEVYHIPHNRYDEAKQIQLKIDDVLMTKDGTIGKLLYIDQIPYPGKASLNSHLLVFRPLNNRYIPKFLFYQLDSNIFKNHIELEKSGTTFFGITQEGVGKYKILLPPLPEQQRITEILSIWETAIELNEKELNQLKEQKRGLMQLLLTGIVRVEVD